jgi:hypothetical protein
MLILSGPRTYLTVFLTGMFAGFALGVASCRSETPSCQPTIKAYCLPIPPKSHLTQENEMESWIAVKTNHVNIPCNAFMFQHGRCL